MGKMPKGWKFIAELPPRNDCETVFEKSWDIELPDGLDYEGQHFAFPQGLSVASAAQWLEPSLLSVQLSLGATLAGECARCLENATLAISDNLMYLYYSRGLQLGKDTEMASDEGFMPVEIDFFERTLDITEQVWESLLLLLPYRLLCREDCAGICPYCGTDKNKHPCSCAGDEGDPRFQVLKDFVDPRGTVDDPH